MIRTRLRVTAKVSPCSSGMLKNPGVRFIGFRTTTSTFQGQHHEQNEYVVQTVETYNTSGAQVLQLGQLCHVLSIVDSKFTNRNILPRQRRLFQLRHHDIWGLFLLVKLLNMFEFVLSEKERKTRFFCGHTIGHDF